MRVVHSLAALALTVLALAGCSLLAPPEGPRTLAHPVLPPRTDDEAIAIVMPVLEEYLDQYVDVVNASTNGTAVLRELVATTYYAEPESIERSLNDDWASAVGHFELDNPSIVSIETIGPTTSVRLTVCIDSSNLVISDEHGVSVRDSDLDPRINRTVVVHNGEGTYKLAAMWSAEAENPCDD